MLLGRYERTSTGIRLRDVDGSHIDIVADDALTLLVLLCRDKDKLRNTADEAALARQRKFVPLHYEIRKEG